MTRMKLSLITVSILMACNYAQADEIPAEPVSSPPAQTSESEGVEFNDGFLSGYGIDVSKFSNGNPVIPGHYTVRFVTNNAPRGEIELDFIDVNKDGVGQACLTRGLLKKAGVKVTDEAYEAAASAPDADKECVDLKKYIPNASWRMDVNTQVFTLNVPQINTYVSDDGTIDPELWDNGINAFLMSYSLNGYTSKNDQGTNRSVSGNYNVGLNLGAWRFRSSAYSTWDQDNGSTFDTGDYYVERDVAFLKGQIRLGSAYSDGQLFDSFNVKGFTIKSDDRMLPMSQQGFFPVIRGVAETNAKITVKQDDYVIYETTVPPGNFEFSNIRSANVGTDIQVEITEADGRVKKFVVPYSTSSQMLRPGVSRYNFTAGEFQGNSNYDKKPLVAQGTWQQGLTNNITAYAGLQGTQNYWATVIGGTLNTLLGAFSFDVTNSNTNIPDGKKYVGQSYQLSYEQFIDATQTNFQLAAYRYSTSGYFSLTNAMDYIHDKTIRNLDEISRSRNKFQVNISQALPGDFGSIYVNGSIEDYWDKKDGRNTQYQVGYSNTWGRVSYSISASKYYDSSEGTSDTQIYLNFSVPLDWSVKNQYGDKRPIFDNLNVGYSTNDKHDNNTNMGASGYNPDLQMSYGINATYNTTRESSATSSISGNTSLNTRFANLGGSVTRGNEGNQQLSLSASGGMVLHSGGFTFAPDVSLSGPMALIEAKGAAGSKVQNGNGRVDGNGYALATNLSPYMENPVGLDISDMKGTAEMKGTSTSVIPHDGSIVRVKFDTDERRFILFIAKMRNGYIPLGADVYNAVGEHLGNAAQGGKLITRGAADEGVLLVRWGDNDENSCRVPYKLPPMDEKADQDETMTVEGLLCE